MELPALQRVARGDLSSLLIPIHQTHSSPDRPTHYDSFIPAGARSELLEVISHRCSYWRHVITKELATLNALNLLSFDLKQRVVCVAEGWVPASHVPKLKQALVAAANAVGRETRPIINILETNSTPPTYLPTNKFTAGFQARADGRPGDYKTHYDSSNA